MIYHRKVHSKVPQQKCNSPEAKTARTSGSSSWEQMLCLHHIKAMVASTWYLTLKPPCKLGHI